MPSNCPCDPRACSTNNTELVGYHHDPTEAWSKMELIGVATLIQILSLIHESKASLTLPLLKIPKKILSLSPLLAPPSALPLHCTA
jgi:hypothetical protein